MIRLDAISKTYDGVEYAVRDITLDVDAGEFIALLGASGCGKTTTLKMINRLIEPTAGTIHVDGIDVTQTDPVELRRGIGYVFQGIGLFPHLTVAENVAVVPRLLGWERSRTAARTDELLELVQLDPAQYRQRSPRELSGGQQQRVGLARALAARPKVMLMDEPFGALDPLTRDELQQAFADIRRRLDLTVVMVTHDMTEALLLTDRIAVMDAGRIVALDTPVDLMRDTTSEQVRRLLDMPRRQTGRLEAIMAGPDVRSGEGADRT